ncbi:MAG: tol-pal system protein YbgF [Vicinamibacteria bacterium]
MKHKVLLTSALALGLAGAFSSSTAAAQKKEDIILAELRQIQAQLAQLQTAQAALKSTLDTLSEGAAEQQDALRKTLADSRIVIERLQQDMSILSERVDETNARIGSLSEEMTSINQSREPIILPPLPTAEAGQEGTGESGAQQGEEVVAPPPVVAAVPNVIDIYNQARNDYTQGRYPLAISGFKDVLELDKRGDLADNARYWMGESYLAQRQYEQALAEFDRIIRDYPSSNKRPDAYLKKAMTLEDMGRRSEANVMYELVIEQFPRTNQERVARRRLEALMKTIPPQPQR